ncbi:MAG: D-aminoacyl-tRNA deacylase [Negativicutes bacterium]|jgi:D-tyrosyl-tRNA(Tyr) deacylase
MRAVIQRVRQAAVVVNDQVVGAIGQGILVLLGVSKEDTLQDVGYLAEKIANLRIFSDADGKMNCSVKDIAGELLIVSQFTLYGDCRKGRRPSFDSAASPQLAEELYEKFVEHCRAMRIGVSTGKFQADMQISLQNDGPVTFVLNSKKEI